MVETYQFKLPLLDAAQAQKHVTVNEALARLDTASQMRLVSISETVPPVVAADGVAYYVPIGAVNAWDGHIGEIAIFANGGWVFLSPRIGWRAWIEDTSQQAMFDGVSWRKGITALSPGGAGTVTKIIEFDHVVTAGWDNDTTVVIEDAMLVHGISGRIISDITGTGITDWMLGVDGATARFGSGHALTAGTWIRGMAYQPQTYWGGEPLKLTAVGGEFTGGMVRLAIHGLMIEVPFSV